MRGKNAQSRPMRHCRSGPRRKWALHLLLLSRGGSEGLLAAHHSLRGRVHHLSAQRKVLIFVHRQATASSGGGRGPGKLHLLVMLRGLVTLLEEALVHLLQLPLLAALRLKLLLKLSKVGLAHFRLAGQLLQHI
jgi:hypothetical protein